MNPAHIEDYVRGGPLLAASIQGLTPADFAAVPVAGTWSIQQIVMHLMDSDLIAGARMKCIIAEENPAIVAFDETAFAEKLFYNKLDPFLAADIFDKNRQLTAIILRQLPPEAANRIGTHSQRGRVTLGEMLLMYNQHLHHHLSFLRHKRQLLGKPL